MADATMLAGAAALLAAAARAEAEGRIDAELVLLDHVEAELTLRRGQLAARAWKLHDAARAFAQVLSLNPGSGEAAMELALLHRLLGQDGVSLSYWRIVARLQPQLDQPWFELARLEAGEQAFDRALELLERLRMPITDGYWLAEIEVLRSAAAEAEAAWRQSDAAAASAPAGRLSLARTLLSLGRCGEALDQLDALPAEFDPVGQAITRYHLARRDDPAGALAGLQAASEAWSAGAGRQPGHEHERIALAETLFREGATEAATSLLGLLATEHPSARPLAARMRFAAGDFPACLALAGQMVDDAPAATLPYQVALGALLAAGAIRPLQGIHAALPVGFNRIPSMLIQYWDEGALPLDVAGVVASWSGRSLQRRLLDRAAASDYIAEHYPAAYLEAFERCHHAAMRSDFVRLCVLAREGGIYLDVDEACRDQPSDLLRAVAGHELVCTVLDQVTPYANNALIAAMPQHAVICACLEEAVGLLLAAKGRADIWKTTGPGLLTRNLVRHLREHGTTGGVALLSEFGWRRLCSPRNSLAYKSAASGNWRLA